MGATTPNSLVAAAARMGIEVGGMTWTEEGNESVQDAAAVPPGPLPGSTTRVRVS